MLVLMFSSFSLMRWATTLLPDALLALVSHSLGAMDNFTTELGNCSVDGNTSHNRGFAVLLGLSFQIEQDLKSASCHNSKNFLQ